MCGQADRGHVHVGAQAHLDSVAAVLGREDFPVAGRVVKAVGPSEIGSLADQAELLGGFFGSVGVTEVRGPELSKLIPAMNHGVQLCRAGMHRDRPRIAHAGRETLAVRLRLAGLVGRETPDARSDLPLAAWILARQSGRPRDGLAGVGRRADADEHAAVGVKGDALGRVVAIARQTVDDGLRRPGRCQGTGGDGIAQHGIVRREVEGAVGKCDARAAIVAPGLRLVGAAVPVEVPQSDHSAALVALVAHSHEYVAVGGDRQLPCGAHARVVDAGTEAFGHRDRRVAKGVGGDFGRDFGLAGLRPSAGAGRGQQKPGQQAPG